MFIAVTAQHRCMPKTQVLAGCLIAASLLLAGCQSRQAKLSDGTLTTASTTAPDGGVEEAPSFKKTGALSKQWEANKGDAAIGLAYADSLEKLGQAQTGFAVLKAVSEANPKDAAVQYKIGKKMLAAGATQDAAAVLERAVAANPSDWQALSALGSVYDQLSRHGEAREKYQAALVINPDAVGVRNNLAMSHALQGQLPEAERMLRELMKSGSGPAMARVRQNLALVVGLQGRFDEARQIASEDLPPEEVDANLGYLQQMLSQPNTWKQLQEG